jgi:signal transduction histidine kinase
VFSVALAIWWGVFGLGQIERFAQIAKLSLEPAAAQQLAIEMERQHRMLMSEGLTLIVLLLGGGATLLYYIRIELRRARLFRDFFATFTHDLKTSIASVRLQAQSLDEDLADSGGSRLAKRLVKDTVRLELQLENSLLLSAPETENRLLIESIRLAPVLQSMRHHWPDLEIAIEGDGFVRADRRALDSVLKNIFQNSIVHGRASRVQIDVSAEGVWYKISLHDDGRGFKGDVTELGQMFKRHSSTSGSGLGLYLAVRLVERLGGVLRVVEASTGFAVEILLPADKQIDLRINASPESGE